MGFRVSIKGVESINLSEKSVISVKFKTDTPQDSNARSTDLGATLTISGKILTALDGDVFDDTIKIAKWSHVPAENADSYREVTAQVVSAGQVVRQYQLPKAFVVDYTESYGDEEGVGTFNLVVKQKKDQINTLKLEGGYEA